MYSRNGAHSTTSSVSRAKTQASLTPRCSKSRSAPDVMQRVRLRVGGVSIGGLGGLGGKRGARSRGGLGGSLGSRLHRVLMLLLTRSRRESLRHKSRTGTEDGAELPYHSHDALLIRPRTCFPPPPCSPPAWSISLYAFQEQQPHRLPADPRSNEGRGCLYPELHVSVGVGSRVDG